MLAHDKLRREEARRERLRQELNSRLWKMVVKQREEDRERRKDPDGMTRAEREEEERIQMVREEMLTMLMEPELERLTSIKASGIQRIKKRLDAIAENARLEALVAAEEMARKEAALREQEALERVLMETNDAEAKAWEYEEKQRLKNEAKMREALEPFVPYFPENDGTEDDVKPWTRNELFLAKVRTNSARQSRNTLRNIHLDEKAKATAKHKEDRLENAPPDARFDSAAAAAAAVAGVSAPPSGYNDRTYINNSNSSRKKSQESTQQEKKVFTMEKQKLEDVNDKILLLDTNIRTKQSLKQRSRRMTRNLLLKKIQPVHFLQPISSKTSEAGKPTANMSTNISASAVQAKINEMDNADYRFSGCGAPAANNLLSRKMQAQTTQEQKKANLLFRTRSKRSQKPLDIEKAAEDVEKKRQMQKNVHDQQIPVTLHNNNQVEYDEKDDTTPAYIPHTKEFLDKKWQKKIHQAHKIFAPDPDLVPFNKGSFGVIARKKDIVSKSAQKKDGTRKIVFDNYA